MTDWIDTYRARQLAEAEDRAAIDRMLETMRWVQWLEVEQRHLVWMRAKRYGWRDITIRFACDRTTAWRRWQRAMEIVAANLNSEGVRLPSKNVGNLGQCLPCLSSPCLVCPFRGPVALQQNGPVGGSISAIFWTAVTVEAMGPGKRGPSWPKTNAGGASAALF